MSTKVDIFRASKYAKVWVPNVFEKWCKFKAFDIERSIANLFEDEGFVMVLINMLYLFILQVAKKDKSLYPPTK
jgi:hypothetical protein